eukprot:TRINITY_DN3588_c1_g1_i2.p1 TRINITY_DN3588_c1_g1~~TRINITY_DN3588_c1_g1_i2.p1  ORF type:complete len:407 (+),score=97.80 TRINITY_DN3588_c1_g1_i2:130-1350(+)
MGTLDLNNLIRKTYELSSKVPVEDPTNFKEAREWDKLSVGQWIDKTGYTKEAKQIYRRVVNLTLGESNKISLLFWAIFCAKCNGFSRISDTTNGAQERLFVGGAHSICREMENKFSKSVQVKLGCFVVSIEQKRGFVEVIYTKGNEKITVKCKKLILALPPTNISQINFTPSLPETKITDPKVMDFNDKYMKVFVVYKTRWWIDLKFSGQLFSDKGPVIWCFDADKGNSSCGVLVGFITADMYEKWGNVPIEKRREAVIQQFYQSFDKDARALNFLSYHEKDWSKEKNYAPCVFLLPPNLASKYCGHFHDTVGDIYFAGSEASSYHWAGYMEGAVFSGEKAAHQILNHSYKEFGVEDPGTFVKQYPRPTDFPALYKGPNFVGKILPSPLVFVLILLLSTLFFYNTI